MKKDKYVVLAVDDRESNLIALRALFGRTHDIELVEAGSGEEALMITLQRVINLILLDVNMPGMDGFETARHLQGVERTRDIPIVFLTAIAKADAFMQRGYDLGAVDYLTKPIEDNLLINRVRLYRRIYESHRALLSNMETLRATQARLLQTEKLAALNPMVIAVAHELNTPIGTCQLTASTMRDETTALLRRWESGINLRRSELKSFLTFSADCATLVCESLSGAARVIDRFKEMAIREHSWTRGRVELQQVVRLCVATVAGHPQVPGLEVLQKIPGDLVLNTYGNALTQVIDELLANSILHGFSGRDAGSIRIEAQMDSDGESVLLTYADNGVGMSAESVEKAFEPFYTTRFGQGRSGLGLSICYNLVTGLLGGQIEIRSSAAGGSEVSIHLPLSAPRRD